MIQNRWLDFLGTYYNSIKSTAQVISFHAPSFVWNSETDLRLQRKELYSVWIAYARFLVSRKCRIHSWSPSIWNSHVETQEGTTGRALAASGKSMSRGIFCRLAGMMLLDSRQGRWLVASGQAGGAAGETRRMGLMLCEKIRQVIFKCMQNFWISCHHFVK